jgi:predicted RNase H-like HicB family nuclease/uncharacterized protein (DUF1778 family)
MDYIALIRCKGDDDYEAAFPDLPGCTAGGSTMEEARLNASEALEKYLADLHESGESIPEPSGLVDLEQELREERTMALMIHANPYAKITRINITVREDHLEEIDRAAAEAGESRSVYMINSALSRSRGEIENRGRWSARRGRRRMRLRDPENCPYYSEGDNSNRRFRRQF